MRFTFDLYEAGGNKIL